MKRSALFLQILNEDILYDRKDKFVVFKILILFVIEDGLYFILNTTIELDILNQN